MQSRNRLSIRRVGRWPRYLPALLGLAPAIVSAISSDYWVERPKVIQIATIALNRPMAELYQINARQNGYWGDPERCGSLFIDYLDSYENRLNDGVLPAHPRPLAAVVPSIPPPHRDADPRTPGTLAHACSKLGMKEYGSWCIDLLVDIGLTRDFQQKLRIAGAQSFLAEVPPETNSECPHSAAEGAAWLRARIDVNGRPVP